MAFLIPFIPWIIGALLSAGAVVVLAEQLKGASGKTLAVIGERKSGKTTFTRLLSQGIVGSEDYSETVVDTMYKGSKIRLKDDTVLHVGDLKDLPGDQSAWLPWKNRVNESDHVLYLVRSHLLRSGQGTARDRCRRDLQQLELWLREIKDKGAKVPTVVLIFSFRDRDSEQASDPISYGQDLIKLGGLEQIVEELRRITRVALVAGSLDSEEAATSLLEQIGHSL